MSNPEPPHSGAADEAHEPATPSRGGMFAALAHRDYRYLQAGTFFSQVGQWIMQMGKGWLVFQLTDSPFQLALVAFFQGMALLIFAPLGGGIADRFDRKKVIIVTQFGVMGVALLVATLVAIDAIRIWHIYSLVFVASALFSLNNPSRQALVHDLVGKRDLRNAVALNSLTANSTRVIGPSIGGGLLASIGVEGTFFVQAACLVVAMAAATRIRADVRPVVAEGRSFIGDLLAGVRYARSDRTVMLLILLGTATAVLAWPYIQLMPAYTSDVLGLGETGFGFAMSTVGVGAVGGSLVLAARDFRYKGRLLLGAQITTGVLHILLALSGQVAFAFFVLVLLGISSANQMANNQTLLQMHVKDEYRGRVMSLYFLNFGLQPAGGLPAGAIGSAFGIEVAFLALGATLIAVILPVAIFSRRMRNL